MTRALVIGSSSGIGLAIARRLCERGHEVVGFARRESAFEAAGYRHVIADVRSPDYPALVAPHADAETVIYCAGIGHELDRGEEAAVFETNLLGLVRTTEVVIPRMTAAGRGHIVGVSSQADRLIDPAAPSYAASKAGMSSYLEGLALALRPRGVFVTNLRLGFVDTAMSSPDGPRPFLATPERIATLVEQVLVKRPVRRTYPRRLMPLVWLANLPARLRAWLR